MDRTYIDFVNNTAREALMRLYGVIGDKVDGDYFAQELASLDSGGLGLVHIRVNSLGRDVFQGMSIVSAILSMDTPVIVHVDGIAASMAAVITVTDDRVCMMDFAKMMIHHPYFSGADAKSLSAKQKKMLTWLTYMLRQVLSRRGKDDAGMAKLMQEEIWFSAEEATDCAAGLVWQEDYVSRSLGESVLFDDQGNPLYYGDIISFLQKAGGHSIRADKTGVILIKQATGA